jgi:predicted RNA binding protein YcfA (HicA-like mRNA interferase family)
MRHDLERLLRAARASGWVVARTKGGHWLLRHPAGGTVVMSSTPSDRRALANFRSQVRRCERRAAA